MNLLVKIQGVDMPWLNAGGLLTALGMVIVFMVLVILIFAIFVFGKIMVAGKNNAPKIKSEEPKKAPIAATAPVAAAVTTANSVQDDELIAVIAAAVDAMYSGSGKKAIIRNIKPAANVGRSAWATAGLMQNVRSF